MEKAKKSRRKKLIVWLSIDLVVAAAVFLLLLDKPAGYKPVMPAALDPNGQRVHPYVSHELMPALYNGAQDRRPFEMVVLDKGLNEAVAQTGWLQQSGGIRLSAPAIAFTPGRVVLMGTADIEGAKFVVTVEIGPRMAEDGRFALIVEKVKIGAMNITPLARVMARKMYKEQIATGGVATDDWRTKIATSLLIGESFDPVFPVDDKWVRLTGFDIVQGRLTARLVQVPKGRN